MSDEMELIPLPDLPEFPEEIEPREAQEPSPTEDTLAPDPQPEIIGRQARREAQLAEERRILEEMKKAAKVSTPIGSLVEMVEVVVGALVAAVLVLTLICRTGVVEGGSMLPTMSQGDRYIISDLFYTPQQGDIVVFRPGIEGKEELWIKRVIALEGQEVYIDPDTFQVYVDGQLLDEPYLSPYTGTIPHSAQNPTVVPEGCVYVLGDNRAISHDSRYEDLGCVEIDHLAGRVILRFFPFDSFEFYGK